MKLVRSYLTKLETEALGRLSGKGKEHSDGTEAEKGDHLRAWNVDVWIFQARRVV